uniref:C2 domain-containing protein n=1 Tax=Musa acuminata subsp. malaccensis TaxID=214687 RepID=A0A804HZM2_MUSAM
MSVPQDSFGVATQIRDAGGGRNRHRLGRRIGKRLRFGILSNELRFRCAASTPPGKSGNPNLPVDLVSSARGTVIKQISGKLDNKDPKHLASSFTNYRDDPLVDKQRTQLGVIRSIPSPPINRNIAGFFVLFFLVGVAFDKVWNLRKREKSARDVDNGTWPQAPTSLSIFLEKDLRRKESVEWVNMVLGKLWKVYRSRIEDWVIGLLQPVIDNLKKPDYVQRVEIKQFSIGDEPLSVRSVERRTSRGVNDLQFLTRLLTEDLPRLFVLPKKIVLDFQKGKALGPVSHDFKVEAVQERSKDFVGELSVTLVDARKLAYPKIGKTDPYVVLTLGDQVFQSKKNSQTTVTGPPGEPIWNQDFDLFVVNPGKQKLYIQVKDSFGFADFTVGTAEVELESLQDTVPADRVVALRGGWSLFRNKSSGEVLLRLTYKAYVEDEEDDLLEAEFVDDHAPDDISDYDQPNGTFEQSGYPSGKEREAFMDVLAALIVSEEFQGIVTSETENSEVTGESRNVTSPVSTTIGLTDETSTIDSNRSSSSSDDLELVWLAVVTVTVVLIARTMGDSSLFNP